MSEENRAWLEALSRAVLTLLKAAVAAIVLVIAVLVLFGPGEARAQLTMPDGKLNTACAGAPRVPPLALPPPPRLAPGLPKQLGGTMCTEALLTADSTGGAVGWWCPKVTPEKAQIALYAVTWDAVTLPMLIDFGRLLLVSDKAAHLLEMQTKYRSLHILDMCNVWNPLTDRLNAIYPEPLPLPPPVYVATHAVKPNAAAADKSRPIYRLASDGTLGTQVIGRAAAGTDCDTRMPTKASGADLYATPVGRSAGEVALCAKKP